MYHKNQRPSEVPAHSEVPFTTEYIVRFTQLELGLEQVKESTREIPLIHKEFGDFLARYEKDEALTAERKLKMYENQDTINKAIELSVSRLQELDTRLKNVEACEEKYVENEKHKTLLLQEDKKGKYMLLAAVIASAIPALVTLIITLFN